MFNFKNELKNYIIIYQMSKQLDEIITIDELNEFIKTKPDYISADDIMFAIVRINEIERSKHVKVNSGCISKFLASKKNKMNNLITV
jgi:hypothetical protein